MRELTIVTSDGEKGKSFTSTLLYCVEADQLWDSGNSDAHRPILLVLACSEQEAMPVLANLRMGRDAVSSERGYSHRAKKPKYNLMKSAGYHYSMQRHPEGAVITAYLPDLIRVDPGMVDPDSARFVLLPSRQWLRPSPEAERHVRALGYTRDEVPMVCAMAELFAGRLAHHTRAPIELGPLFYAQILCAALDSGYASLSGSEERRDWRDERPAWRGRFGFIEEGDARYAPGVAFSAQHEELEPFLAEQVAVFFGSAREMRRAA